MSLFYIHLPMSEAKNDSEYSVVVERLTQSYGAMKAVDGVSFKIKKGEIVGFLGPNGAGKSTTMKILSGLMPATSGRAYICGVSVANDPKLAQSHLGYMPENNPLPEEMRVKEYLTFRAKIKGVRGRDVKANVQEAMEVCQLHRKASRKIIGNLSKGFRQRVGIADALLSKPDVIIMDEPTIGLDPHQIIAIRELIDSLRGRMSVIISSHILPEIELVCDRVMIINQGRIVASGTPASLREEFLPHNTYEVSAKIGEARVLEIISNMDCGFKLESYRRNPEDSYAEFLLKTNSRENLGAKLVEAFAANPAFALRRVNLKIPSLEDIFMVATRRSWEQTNDSLQLEPQGADSRNGEGEEKGWK